MAFPDMNPLENVMKSNVAQHNPKTKKQLVKWIKYEWTRLPTDYAKHLINSMDRRIDTLISMEGDNTQY